MTPTRRDAIGRMAAVGAAVGLGRAWPPLAGPPGGTAQERLPTREIPGTGERLPIVGLGSSKPVFEIPTEGTEPLVAVIRTLLELGGRVVDTSPRTEEIDARFGGVLQRPDFAERLWVSTKINTADGATGVAQMRQNQRLFGRSTVDLVQIESLRGLDEHWPRLLEWKERGEARYVGVTVSTYANHDRLEAFMRRERPDFVHVNYSVVETRSEERLLPLARDRGMAVLVNRPFMNGSYFGRVAGQELPAWAAEFDCESWAHFSLKYVLSHPGVTCVLTETTSVEHMAENVRAGFGRLPDEAARARMREVGRRL